MTKNLKFYKEENLWYADVPGYIEEGHGTQADLLMVSGADTWLQILAGDKEEVTLKLSLAPFLDSENLRLIKKDGELAEIGAWYAVDKYEGVDREHELWLCPVTLHVFGLYPYNIYYKKL